MTNPGKTDKAASYSSSSVILPAPLSAMPSPQENRVAALCPPSRNCLVRYVGTIWRWEGGLKKVLDHMFIRIWLGCLWVYETVSAHCCVLFLCLSNLMTRLFWNKPGFSKPQWATVGLGIWMDLLKNGNMTGLWELTRLEVFPLTQSTLMWL